MGWSDIVKAKAPDLETMNAKQILEFYSKNPQADDNPLKTLTVKERAHIKAEIEDIPVSRLGFHKDPETFTRPRVISALDQILEKAGLTDQRLSRRLSQIIFHAKGANADNNSHNAIRTVFQLKGKFAPERHEFLHRSDLENLSEDQLNRIIEAGVKEYSIMKVKLEPPRKIDANS